MRRVIKKETYQARRLRREMPPAEKELWLRLKGFSKQFGISFRRQQPIPPYSADFACLSAKVVVEIDGASHEAKQEKDRKREAFLKACGFDVLRFPDREVLENPEGVAETILSFIRGRGR